MTTETFFALDFGKPNRARVGASLWGSKDTQLVDREFVETHLRLRRTARDEAREMREFRNRALTYTLGDDVQQVIHLACGLPSCMPSAPDTHQVAHRLARRAVTCYLDDEPYVIPHGNALLGGGWPRTSFVWVDDIRSADDVLAKVAKHGKIDLSRPVVLLALNVLHAIEDDSAAAAMLKAYCAQLSPGSYVVVTHPVFEPDAPDTRHYRESFSLACRRPPDIVGLIPHDWPLVLPALVPVSDWRPTLDPERTTTPTPGCVGAVAFSPRLSPSTPDPRADGPRGVPGCQPSVLTARQPSAPPFGK